MFSSLKLLPSYKLLSFPSTNFVSTAETNLEDFELSKPVIDFNLDLGKLFRRCSDIGWSRENGPICILDVSQFTLNCSPTIFYQKMHHVILYKNKLKCLISTDTIRYWAKNIVKLQTIKLSNKNYSFWCFTRLDFSAEEELFRHFVALKKLYALGVMKEYSYHNMQRKTTVLFSRFCRNHTF